MKKLLTLLFTLVLAITVACINTNTVKAEPNDPVDYTLWLHSDGSITDIEEATVPCPSGLTYDKGVWKMNGLVFSTTASNGIVVSENTTIEIQGTNSISCNSNSATNAHGAIAIIDPFSYSNVKLTIRSVDGTNNHSLTLINPGNMGSGIDFNYNNVEILSGSINANGNSFTIVCNNLKVKDAELVINTSYDDISFSALNVQGDNGLVINGSGKIKCIAPNASALHVCSTKISYYTNGFIIKGTVDGSTSPLYDVTWEMVNDGIYSANIGETPTSYLEITVASTPTPTPTPDKKDESCEKVIGPTWHWNNTKGVCEEYATVGTYTR